MSGTQQGIKLASRPGKFAIIRTIGWISFSEIVRDKILYAAVGCAFFLLSVTFLASRLTFARPERIILNIGLTAINVACAIIAILVGAVLVSREFERRTIFVILSKPITRIEFLVGKYTGLAMILTLNWLLMSLVYFSIFKATGGEITATLLWADFFVLLLGLLLGAVSIFFSSFSTTSLSIILSIGVYLIGTNISQIKFLADKTENPLGVFALRTVAALFPNLEHFSLGFNATYGLPIESAVVWITVGYFAAFAVLFLVLSGFLIHRREI